LKTNTQQRLEIVEKKLGELVADSERRARESEVWNLGNTITRESWWDSLDPEQYQEALDAMQGANQLLVKRIGLHADLVTITRGW
jgi:hypothetical protein